MKTIKKLSILFLVALLITSCGKIDINPDDKDDSGSSASKVTGTMKATLDGKAWEAKTISFGGILATTKVNGKIDDTNLISLEFADTNLEINKTYAFDTKNAEANILGNLLVQVNGKTLFAKNGTFVFSKYKKNSMVEGEINAELTNFIDTDISLENCKFSMEYK